MVDNYEIIYELTAIFPTIRNYDVVGIIKVEEMNVIKNRMIIIDDLVPNIINLLYILSATYF